MNKTKLIIRTIFAVLFCLGALLVIAFLVVVDILGDARTLHRAGTRGQETDG